MPRKNVYRPRYQRVTAAVCSLLFLSFSFSYLYMMQGELVRCLCEETFGGRISYSPLWGAVAITLFLWMVRWVLNLFTRWEGIGMAFSYFPAYWALAFLTCVSPVTSAAGVSSLGWPHWSWFLVALGGYFLVSLVCKYRRQTSGKRGLLETLIPNLLILILLSCATGSVGNSNELLHHELRVARFLREQRYDDALLVGKKSLHNTPVLTALRALALSHMGEMGGSLFEYPQGYGADGLFFPEGESGVCGLADADIEEHLGGFPRKDSESVTDYLNRLYEADSVATSCVADYYLCALLLERQLPRFHQVLLQYWPADKALPRHYQEALLVYQQQAEVASSLAALCTSETKERYKAFLQLQDRYELPLHRNNYTRRKFGDTYWWYYSYGE